MNFLSPLAFSALSFSVFVAAVYFLKKRPQPYTVSALFLWPQAATKSRTSWRWYKAPIWLLLLQLLVLALLVGALSQPVVFTQAQSAGRMALIIDTSASMQTRTQDGTRFSQAVARALKVLRDQPYTEVTLIEARQGGGVLLPLSADHQRLQTTLAGLVASHLGDAPLTSVTQWVRSQASWEEFDRVLWFSDRLPDDPNWQDFPIEFDLVSTGFGNAAINAFVVRLQPDASLGYEGFVQVENFSSEPLQTTLELISPGVAPLLNAPVDIEPESEVSYTFPLSQPLPQRLTVKLDVIDSLAFDNQRYFAFRPTTKPRVFWMGEADSFFEQAFKALGVQSILPWTPGVQLEPSDLIVVHDATLPRDVTGNVLLVNADWEGIVDAEIVQPVTGLRATDLTHPVLTGITAEDIVVLNARLSRLPEGFVPLLEAEGVQVRGKQPVLGVYQAKGVRMGWLGFSLQDSNLRLTVDFPILIANLLNWLVPLPLEAAVVDTGNPLQLKSSGLRLQLPSGEVVTVDRTAFLDTEIPGFYTVLGNEQAWAVNVPTAESQPQLAAALTVTTRLSRASAVEETTAQPLWFYLGWLGLLALGLEWMSYERGWM